MEILRMSAFQPDFERPMYAERATLMLPLHVVMAARIRGHIDLEQIRSTLEELRSRHALLAVRISVDEDDKAWYTNKDVPVLPFRVIERKTDPQWLDIALEEYKTSFPMGIGPLVRFALVHSDEVSELIICGHHAICDAISLTYLIRDILKKLAKPSDEVAQLPFPPAVDFETVPNPPQKNFVANIVTSLINRAWRKKNLRFDFNLMNQMHERYWQKNSGIRQFAWQLSESDTTKLVKCCREKSVTVNSTLWAAFLVAQNRVQGSVELFRNRAGLAISTREKLKIPVGESFGFYASSHRVLLKNYQGKPFWDSVTTIHQQLKRSIDSADPFKMLSATFLCPTLIDSLYFCKYGFSSNGISDKLLKKMMWDKVNYGCVITNVGRVDIPTSYGNLQLDAVYGPLVYSDVNEKTVGVITVGKRITFWMSYNESIIDSVTATKFRDAIEELIQEAIE
jgi:NRPS condensation-like uncharacterized protein